MLSQTYLPTWGALHPAAAHFPVALLLAAPALALLAMLLARHRRLLMTATLYLLLAGTLASYLCAATGDAAKTAATQSPEVSTAIPRHETFGSAVRAVSTALTAVLACLLFGPRLLRRELGPRAFSALVVVFVALAMVLVPIVVITGHSGGVLVHALGVHAPLQ